MRLCDNMVYGTTAPDRFYHIYRKHICRLPNRDGKLPTDVGLIYVGQSESLHFLKSNETMLILSRIFPQLYNTMNIAIINVINFAIFYWPMEL